MTQSFPRQGGGRGPGPQDRGGPRPGSGQGPGGAGQPPRISAEDARAIVAEDDAERLVQRARELATYANDNRVTRTSVRRLYGEVKRIQMTWRDPEHADQ